MIAIQVFIAEIVFYIQNFVKFIQEIMIVCMVRTSLHEILNDSQNLK